MQQEEDARNCHALAQNFSKTHLAMRIQYPGGLCLDREVE